MGMLLRRRYDDVNTQGVVNTAAPASVKAEENADKAFEYTEEVIKSMNGAKLRKLAKENGIDSPEDLTASELKSVLIELLVK